MMKKLTIRLIDTENGSNHTYDIRIPDEEKRMRRRYYPRPDWMKHMEKRCSRSQHAVP